jgi:hypothetical protein
LRREEKKKKVRCLKSYFAFPKKQKRGSVYFYSLGVGLRLKRRVEKKTAFLTFIKNTAQALWRNLHSAKLTRYFLWLRTQRI